MPLDPSKQTEGLCAQSRVIDWRRVGGDNDRMMKEAASAGCLYAVRRRRPLESAVTDENSNRPGHGVV